MQSVLESFRRVRSVELARAFYQLLLARDRRSAEMFAQTDFDTQRELLLHGIYTLLEFANGSATGRMAIKRLAETHGRRDMNVTADMYRVWIDSLVEVVARLDPHFSPTLEREWRAALQQGIDHMLELA